MFLRQTDWHMIRALGWGYHLDHFLPTGAGHVDSNGLMEGIDLDDASSVPRHWEAALLDANSAIDMYASFLKV